MKVLAILLALALCAAPAAADITGAYAYGGEHSILPGMPIWIQFFVCNGALDESIATIEIDITDAGGTSMCWWFAHGSYSEIEPDRPNWEGQSGVDGAVFVDADGGVGEVFPGESLTLWVNISLMSSYYFKETYEVIYIIHGDGAGDEPHEVLGVAARLHLPPLSAVAETSWGAVKALFR